MDEDSQPRSDIATQPVFFESSLNYRQWFPIGFFLVFAPASVWLLCDLTRTLVTKPIGQCLTDVLFSVAWLSLAGTGTVLLGWRIFFRPVLKSRIDGAGIWIGRTLHPWVNIDSLWGQQAGNGVILSFREKSLLKLDQGIPMAQPVTQDDYVGLLEELESYLGERFPDVDLG